MQSAITTHGTITHTRHRQTQMIARVEWLRHLRSDSDPCLEHFEAFSEEMRMMYGDTDRKLHAAINCMTDYLQGANEPVRVNANRIEANWRAVGWLPQDNKNLYDITSRGLPPGLKSKMTLLTPKNGKFDSMEELFDHAAESEVKPVARSPNSCSHLNSKGSQVNKLNKGVGNATSNHQYPSRPKQRSLTS